MMKTEKRKANVGERILITSATMAGGRYANGDIATVKIVLDGGVKVTEFSVGLFHKEYEVIVETPKKSARITALESQVSELQAKVEALQKANVTVAFKEGFPYTERFERESAEMDGILADIKRKAKPKPTLEALLAMYPSSKLSANERRADVIRYAKAYLEDAKVVPDHGGTKAYLSQLDESAVGYYCNVDFHVNSDKRTVIALLKWRYNGEVKAKGIAKCDPDDVFNADIGKAIALARALGVEVPEEFVKAVQPTEIVLGHRIFYTTMYPNILVIAHPSKPNSPEVSLDLARAFASSNRILDDSNAVYE